MPKEAYERETLLAALQEIGSDGGTIDLASLGLDFGGQPDVERRGEAEGAGEAEEIPEVDSPLDELANRSPRRLRRRNLLLAGGNLTVPRQTPPLGSLTSSGCGRGRHVGRGGDEARVGATEQGQGSACPDELPGVPASGEVSPDENRACDPRCAALRCRGTRPVPRPPAVSPTRSRSGSTTPKGRSASGSAAFGKPGIVAATSGTAVPRAAPAAGAQTVYWHMKLGALVGTTTAPADPATITASVDKLFANAVASSGCETPYIALNELNGASTTTPWTATNSRYRQNILDVLRALQAKGARPFLLVSSFPYTGGDAAGWWREAAQVADIVPEVYFNAPAVMRQGVILGSAGGCGTTLRNAIAAYTAIGIPVSKLGVVLGFQSGPGAGGREGLQPSEQWFRVHQAVHARCEADRGRVRDRDGVVVGVGDLQHRRRRPRQAGGCVRLPLDA